MGHVDWIGSDFFIDSNYSCELVADDLPLRSY